MEARKKIIAMLDLMQRPAFCVEDGCICHCNRAASGYLLETGAAILPLIAAGAEEYGQFTDGHLYLTLDICGVRVGAAVTKMDGIDIFFPEQASEMAELNALALAARQLRGQLSGLISATEPLLPDLAPGQAAQINRRIYQMLRTISNMTDAPRYMQPNSGRMEYVEICGLVEEIAEKTATLLEKMGIQLEYHLPNEAIYTIADQEKLERAIYNLLSNAAKFSPPGGSISLNLVRQKQRLYLSVTDQGPSIAGDDIFTRFLREPALEDSRCGIGLGMVMVRATAAMHGGAVLLDHPDNCNRITMTMALEQPKEHQLRSPILRMDYAGERDHALIELSDVLPAALYSMENMQ